jgi:hypothetical protein
MNLRERAFFPTSLRAGGFSANKGFPLSLDPKRALTKAEPHFRPQRERFQLIFFGGGRSYSN